MTNPIHTMGRSSLLQVMIMIRGMALTVQLELRVDSGIIMTVTTLTLTDNHLKYITGYSSVR